MHPPSSDLFDESDNQRIDGEWDIIFSKITTSICLYIDQFLNFKSEKSVY
ncbi:hypothetical protein J588_0664 [Acinetobacter sp. 1578804]|nr:hypothetical protein J588_0664 [Acinetobacter sp. 1578804]EXR41387.1 hypothetical protein J655_2510 [Acinetobacter sp. 1294243]